jgi:cephalosporin-C deacetylase
MCELLKSIIHTLIRGSVIPASRYNMQWELDMKYVDDRINEYETYMPELTKREDFDTFWEKTLNLSRAASLNATITEYPYPSPYVKVYELTYEGYDGTVIRGWYLLPSFLKKEQYPCLIHYHGFSGDRGRPHNFMHWVLMGMAVVSVECRLQGGETGSNAVYEGGLFQNVNSLGVLNKDTYYYRSVYMDCLRAVDFAVSREEVDNSQIVLHGASQGGALVMAVAALDDRPALAMADVPSNSNIEARIEGEHGSFACLAEYIRRYPERQERIYETVSYFDTMNMADRIHCPVLASVALKDMVCPAKCYYATYNRIPSDKDIKVYPFNGHDGCGNVHMEYKLNFLKRYL